MKLSARARYAARILLELAKGGNKTPMSASVLSQKTGVSVQFVEQILKPLKQHGLTTSVRGAAGGHHLAKPSHDISLGEIIRIMEGGIRLTLCCNEKQQNCPRQHVCLTRKAWVHVSKTLEKELDTITIAGLLHDESLCLESEIEVMPRMSKSRKTTQEKKTAAQGTNLKPAQGTSGASAMRRVRGVRRIIR